jgi:hypothetical protein
MDSSRRFQPEWNIIKALWRDINSNQKWHANTFLNFDKKKLKWIQVSEYQDKAIP